MKDTDKTYTHPSYGMVSISHRSGSPKLFHSALDHHYNYITISVKTAELIRTDTGDRLYGPMHGNIVEIDLSANQFAELITTANIGLGVACTIRSRESKQVPPPPDIDSQPENIRTEFKARAKEFAKQILADAAGIKDMLKSKATINKGDREKINGVLTQISQELEQNMPFLVEMYQEATNKVETSMKAEVEAFMVGAVRQAGLAALAAGQVNIEPPQLPAKQVVETAPQALRPRLAVAIAEVMGEAALTSAQVCERLAAKGWLPQARNPKAYVSFTMSTESDLFEKVGASDTYKVKALTDKQ